MGRNIVNCQFVYVEHGSNGKNSNKSSAIGYDRIVSVLFKCPLWRINYINCSITLPTACITIFAFNFPALVTATSPVSISPHLSTQRTDSWFSSSPAFCKIARATYITLYTFGEKDIVRRAG